MKTRGSLKTREISVDLYFIPNIVLCNPKNSFLTFILYTLSIRHDLIKKSMATTTENTFFKLCEAGNCKPIREFLKTHKMNLQRVKNKVLVRAVETNNLELLEILLSLDGVNPSYRANHPLRAAIFSSNMEMIELLLSHPKTNIMNKCYKVLKTTSSSDNIIVIRKILERVHPRYLFGMWYHYVQIENILMISKFKLLMEQWFFLNAENTKTAIYSIENFCYASLTYASDVKATMSMNFLVENFIHHTNAMFTDMIRLYIQLKYNHLLRVIFGKMEQIVFESLWKRAVTEGDVVIVDFILRRYGSHPSVDIHKAIRLAKEEKKEAVEKRLYRELDFQLEIYRKLTRNIMERSNNGE